MTWTDARIAQLSRLWAQGVSAGGIAEALGDVSRSAVLGKLHRLQLLGSRKPASPPRRYEGPAPQPRLGLPDQPTGPAAQPQAFRPPELLRPPEPPRSPWREAAFAPLSSSAPRPWLTREAGECAFPVAGEGAELVSCCAPTRAGSGYCAQHHRIVFRAVPRAMLAAERRGLGQAAEDRVEDRGDDARRGWPREARCAA